MKKNFPCEALVVTFQKKIKTFYHFFKTFPLFSRLFLGLENCWANFKNSKLCTNPVKSYALTQINTWSHASVVHRTSSIKNDF